VLRPSPGNSPTGPYLEIEGFKDGVIGGALIGWARDEFDPGVRLAVEIHHGNRLLATITADQFRQDLHEANIGDGQHAFVYPLPPELHSKDPDEFHVKVAGTRIELFAAPRRQHLPLCHIPPPPEEFLRATGHANVAEFMDNGLDVAIVCRKYGRLRSHGIVLDMGCGVGRLALPLTQYLGAAGRYEGVDVMRGPIDWCSQNIATAYPNFRFRHQDVRSTYYNPEGTISPASYIFPFDSNSFDLVFLGSVFTHLLPKEMTHYLAEITRLLRPGGRCLMSYFLLEDGVLKDPHNKSRDACFAYDGAGYWTTNKDVPEAAVAYEETDVRSAIAEKGLSIVEPIHYGAQDLVVAVK
jgi:SAM-dependent methyltransferase